MDSELLRLSDLLTGAAPTSGGGPPGPATPGFGTARRSARPSSAAAAAPEAGLPSSVAAHELGVQLHSSLAKELSALDALFARWQAGECVPAGGGWWVGCYVQCLVVQGWLCRQQCTQRSQAVISGSALTRLAPLPPPSPPNSRRGRQAAQRGPRLPR